jgi:hypothetical protein
MKKNLLNELNQMKYLFGYEKGRVISEQKGKLKEDEYEKDIMFADPDVMEPEIKPDTDRDVEEKPYRPGRPDRDPSRLPYTDPDTHPQGEFDDLDIDFGPDVAPAPTREKERTKEKDAPTKPGTPPKRRGNPFKNPNPGVKEDPRGEKKNKEKMKQDFIGLINRAF